MPELPEVETVRRRLSQVIVNRTIHQVQVLREKSFQGDPSQIIGSSINQVERRAKLLRLATDGDLDLLVHLKMTGQLIFVGDQQRVGGGHPTADWVQQLPGDHTRVIIDFQDGTKLFFNDMRVFGWIKALTEQQIEKELAKYGPDVNSPDFTSGYLEQKLSNRTTPIKQAIMIGSIVGGVGNIYASEALFVAGIDPRRPAGQLKQAEYRKIVTALKQVIQAGIEAGGTTFDGSYVDVDGLAGSYQEKLRVYGQEGEPCPNCAGQVKKIKIGQRGTYFCSSCQD